MKKTKLITHLIVILCILPTSIILCMQPQETIVQLSQSDTVPYNQNCTFTTTKYVSTITNVIDGSVQFDKEVLKEHAESSLLTKRVRSDTISDHESSFQGLEPFVSYDDLTDAECYAAAAAMSPSYKKQRTLSPSKSLSPQSCLKPPSTLNATLFAQQTVLDEDYGKLHFTSSSENTPLRAPKILSPRAKITSPPKSPPKKLVPLNLFTKTQELEESLPLLQHEQTPALVEAVYFSPAIRPVLLNLIRQETKGYLAAIYSFDDIEIAQELAKKAQSYSNFKSLVFLSNGQKVKEGNKAHVQQILRNAATPILFHRQVNRASTDPHDKSKFFEEMHHKLCIFFDINGRPLLFTGSYNFTHFAHEKSYENAYLTQDPHCILQYLDALESLYKYREPRTLPDNHFTRIAADLRQHLYELAKLNPTPSVTAYFTPHISRNPSTNVLFFLETIFSKEKKGVIAVQNNFTYFDIARWWVKGKQAAERSRLFDGYLIVDKEYNKQFCSGLHHLITHNIPVFAHTGPNKVHDKYTIFLENENNLSVVVSGSANFTANSLCYDFNNLFATSDQTVVMHFLQKAGMLKKNTRMLTSATARTTQNFSRYRAAFNHIPETLLDNVTSKSGGALCRENYSLYTESRTDTLHN